MPGCASHRFTSVCIFFKLCGIRRSPLYCSLHESIRGIKLSLNGYRPGAHNVICVMAQDVLNGKHQM